MEKMQFSREWATPWQFRIKKVQSENIPDQYPHSVFLYLCWFSLQTRLCLSKVTLIYIYRDDISHQNFDGNQLEAFEKIFVFFLSIISICINDSYFWQTLSGLEAKPTKISKNWMWVLVRNILGLNLFDSKLSWGYPFTRKLPFFHVQRLREVLQCNVPKNGANFKWLARGGKGCISEGEGFKSRGETRGYFLVNI